MCFYILNFRTHTFASASNTTEAIAEANRFIADGASKDEIEIVNAMDPDVRYDIDSFVAEEW